MKYLIILPFILTSFMVKAQDIFKEHLYNVELIMKNEQKLKLTDNQFETIGQLYNMNIGKFNEKKWQLDREMRKLSELMSQSQIDIEKATEHLEKVLSIEREIKLLHLTVLSKVKNELTAEQQSQLDQMD